MQIIEAYHFDFSKSRISSPIQRTIDVTPIINAQSTTLNGTTLNISPPTATMIICPTRMVSAMKRNSEHPSDEAQTGGLHKRGH